MSTFSSEQLNLFKFASVILDEFPTALRHVFVYLWDSKVAPTPSFKAWDDSLLVRNMFLSKEGGKTKSVPTNKSYEEWDCTALFEATLYAQSFAVPGPGRKGKTLADLYLKGHRLPRGVFHASVTSTSGNNDETIALALDQLRLLRNSLCHNHSSKIDKKTFDQYIQLSKDALAALGQSFTRIDDIGKLAEVDFPTARVQQLEQELRREKLRAIEDVIHQIDDQVKDGLANVSSEVTDLKKEVKDFRSCVKDVRAEVLDTRTKVENVESVVKNVRTGVENVKTTAEDVMTHVKDVKKGLEDVKTSVEDVELNMNEVKTEVIGVNRNMEDVCSDLTEVKTGLADVETKLDQLKASVDDITPANARWKGRRKQLNFPPYDLLHFF